MKQWPWLAALLLAECANVPVHGAGRCDAAPVSLFVGTLATSEVGNAAIRRSRARLLRWLQPGTMASMDFRQDRLNVRLDARNYITSVDCG